MTARSKPMVILGLETSTELCSVGLLSGGEIHVQTINEPRQHTQRIMQMIDDVLAVRGVSMDRVEGVTFGRGPGSFTGVRIAIALSQGLAKGLQVPALGVSSLRVIAQNAMTKVSAPRFHVAQDARLGEVYQGRFTRDVEGIAQVLEADSLADPESIVLRDGDFALGNAWTALPSLKDRYADLRDLSNIRADAKGLIELAAVAPAADWENPDSARAAYLRNDVASKPKKPV
ncbi:MAG: tRNA (adenosine(37)-N6)-threonylcarbamoyltransferase complex dimerization subunit type 1 TsaB [Woeseiaceae bacterium]